MNLRAIRKSFELSQQPLADELKVNVATYSKIERGEIQLTVDRLIILCNFFGLSPNELLTFPEENKKNGKLAERKNVTYIPVVAQAGFFNDPQSTDFDNSLIKFSIPVFHENDLILLNLEGDSMYPTFSNGDHIVVRQLKEGYQLKWGEPYLIAKGDGQVIKRVMKSTSKEKLLLKSDNQLYEPYEIDLDTIETIWEIKGVISKNLAPRLLRQS